MLRCCNAKIALWQIRYSVVSKFTFIPAGLAVRDLNNIWIKLLCFHGLIRFKIEEAKLYSLKQIIVFYNSPAFAAIIYDYTIITLRQNFGLHTVPVLIETGISHYTHSNQLVITY